MTTYTHIVNVRSFDRQDLELKYILCESLEEAQVKMLKQINEHAAFLREMCKDKKKFLDFLSDAGDDEDLYDDEEMDLFKIMMKRDFVLEEVKDQPWVFVPCCEALGYEQAQMGTILRIEPFTRIIKDNVYAGEF